MARNVVERKVMISLLLESVAMALFVQDTLAVAIAVYQDRRSAAMELLDQAMIAVEIARYLSHRFAVKATHNLEKVNGMELDVVEQKATIITIKFVVMGLFVQGGALYRQAIK